jgi:hypothetical protein
MNAITAAIRTASTTICPLKADPLSSDFNRLMTVTIPSMGLLLHAVARSPPLLRVITECVADQWQISVGSRQSQCSDRGTLHIVSERHIGNALNCYSRSRVYSLAASPIPPSPEAEAAIGSLELQSGGPFILPKPNEGWCVCNLAASTTRERL